VKYQLEDIPQPFEKVVVMFIVLLGRHLPLFELSAHVFLHYHDVKLSCSYIS
jgi:hypothetical protein